MNEQTMIWFLQKIGPLPIEQAGHHVMDGFLRLSAKSKPGLLSADFLSAVGRYLRFGAGAALGSLQGTFGSGDVKAACAGGAAFLSVDCRTVVPYAERHRGLSGIVEKAKRHTAGRTPSCCMPFLMQGPFYKSYRWAISLHCSTICSMASVVNTRQFF